jgi:hypothetical protein
MVEYHADGEVSTPGCSIASGVLMASSLNRWQAFMFGRPLTICNHHFDTHCPSAFDSSYDPTGRLHLPYIHLFRLAEALCDVMDDAVSVRPVPYERVIIAQDQVLE